MKAKKMTREKWEEIEMKEIKQEEKIEAECERLANTKPIKERLNLVKKVLEK